MTKYEKFMNYLFKIAGIIYLFNFVLYLLNLYQPCKISIAINMLIIGVFCLFVKCSKNENNEEE
jgi:uncharacterized protein YhhL (DUF1145 family)